MTLNFYLHYHTQFGQTLFVSGNSGALGNNDITKAIPLQYLNDQFCHCQVEISSNEIEAANIEYRYILKDAQGNEIIEWKDEKCIEYPENHITEIALIDTWNHAGTTENAFYTKPFRDVLLTGKQIKESVNENIKYSHEFKVKCPLLNANEVVCLIGSGKDLGEWNTESPILLFKKDTWWTTKINLSKHLFR